MYKTKNLGIFVVVFTVMMIVASIASATNVGSISPAFASAQQLDNNQSSSSQTDHEQPTLETVDTHLEECIQQLEGDNADEALSECRLADEELHKLLVNSTG